MRSNLPINRTDLGGELAAADPLALIGQIVDDDVIAHLIGRGIKNPAGIEPRKLVDKTLPVEICAEHKGIDLDAALGATPYFLESFTNNSAMEHR